MSETKCQVFPSGTTSWHVWEVGAKEGDPCQCGQLPYVECHVPKEPGKYDGTTMREVLEWASENVLFARFVGDPQNLWFVDLGIVHPIRYLAPTLYDALYEAWESREVKP